MKGAAKSGDVALAGKDGAAAKELLRAAQQQGMHVLHLVCGDAFGRLRTAMVKGGKPVALFTDAERQRVADALAATNATADLLGRSRVRERQRRAIAVQGLHKLADEQPFSTFAETGPLKPLPPARAIEYFKKLVPTLADDPDFVERQERTGFTMAVATEETLLEKAKGIILEALKSGSSTDIAAADIRELLESVGVAPRNPQYSEMVVRTSMMRAYNEGAMHEMRDPDVQSTFPAWRYAAITDVRARPHHAARNGKLYPSSVDFATVRGTDASDVINCRCSFIPVSRFEIEDDGLEVESTW